MANVPPSTCGLEESTDRLLQPRPRLAGDHRQVDRGAGAVCGVGGSVGRLLGTAVQGFLGYGEAQQLPLRSDDLAADNSSPDVTI